MITLLRSFYYLLLYMFYYCNCIVYYIGEYENEATNYGSWSKNKAKGSFGITVHKGRFGTTVHKGRFGIMVHKGRFGITVRVQDCELTQYLVVVCRSKHYLIHWV